MNWRLTQYYYNRKRQFIELFLIAFCCVFFILNHSQTRSQVRGHQRNSSDNKEFHEVTKRDAQIHFEQELKSLLKTVPNDDLEKFYNNEMERFASLFGRFLQEEGPSVEWDHIQKLPAEAVKNYASLSAPKDSNTVSKHGKYVCNDIACQTSVMMVVAIGKQIHKTQPLFHANKFLLWLAHVSTKNYHYKQ